jgi:hypothetical protein
VILDEAHHSRRKPPGSTKYHGTKRLLDPMLGLRGKIQGLVLLTATPLQVHTVEVWDMLNFLGMSADWTDLAFVRFYDALAKPSSSQDELESISRLFRAFEAQFGEVSAEVVQAKNQTSRIKATQLLRTLRDQANLPRRALTFLSVIGRIRI